MTAILSIPVVGVTILLVEQENDSYQAPLVKPLVRLAAIAAKLSSIHHLPKMMANLPMIIYLPHQLRIPEPIDHPLQSLVTITSSQS
jgi:hypothetical protein